MTDFAQKASRLTVAACQAGGATNIYGNWLGKGAGERIFGPRVNCINLTSDLTLSDEWALSSSGRIRQIWPQNGCSRQMPVTPLSCAGWRCFGAIGAIGRWAGASTHKPAAKGGAEMMISSQVGWNGAAACTQWPSGTSTTRPSDDGWAGLAPADR